MDPSRPHMNGGDPRIVLDSEGSWYSESSRDDSIVYSPTTAGGPRNGGGDSRIRFRTEDDTPVYRTSRTAMGVTMGGTAFNKGRNGVRESASSRDLTDDARGVSTRHGDIEDQMMSSSVRKVR